MVADAMAAIFGKKYGKRKIKFAILGKKVDTDKTYVGTFAFFITSLTLSILFT